MKEWLTAREIASEALPELPKNRTAMIQYAEREGWNDDASFARKRAGRGGGLEYHIRLLPLTAMVAYKRKHLRLGAVDLPPAANDEKVSDISAATRREALNRDARLAVLKQYDRFRDGFEGLERYALQTFVLSYNSRKLHIEDWLIEAMPQITRAQVRRWATKKKKGTSLGFDPGAARKGKSVLAVANAGAVHTTILALLADNAHFSAEHIRDIVESEFGPTLTVVSKGSEKRVPLPPIRTVQWYLKGLRKSEEVTLLRVQNPDRYRSLKAPRGTGALRHIAEPNSLWQIDASPIDALCTDGRHSIYVCLDIATRRMVLLMSRTPRASAVGLLMRKALLAWGLPKTVKTDNGSDFVARDTKRLFAYLGIEIELSAAYTPQQKAHVERAIGDFQHDCATMLPGFVGHSVADRSAIEARRSFAERLGTSDEEAFAVEMNGAELQVQIDRWARTREHEKHSTLGMSPALAAQRSTTPIRHVDERSLDVLLLTVASGGGTRTVTAQGIRVDGSRYMTPTILPGTEVLVRLDAEDMGLVHAFTPDGETFLGVGICPALSGVDPAAAAKALKAMQSEITAKGAAAIKAEIRRLRKGGAWHERILGVREKRIAENVVALPKRTEGHTTPQLEAAKAALDEQMAKRPGKPTDPKVLAEQQRLIAQMKASDDAAREAALEERYDAKMKAREAEIEADRIAHLPQTVRALPESSKAKYVRMVALRDRVDAGDPVDAKDAVLLGRYEESSEFKGHRKMHDVYGDGYLAR